MVLLGEGHVLSALSNAMILLSWITGIYHSCIISLYDKHHMFHAWANINNYTFESHTPHIDVTYFFM